MSTHSSTPAPIVRFDGLGGFGVVRPENATDVRLNDGFRYSHTDPIVDFCYDRDGMFLADRGRRVLRLDRTGNADGEFLLGNSCQFVALVRRDLLAVQGSDIDTNENCIDLLDRRTGVRLNQLPAGQYVVGVESGPEGIALATWSSGGVATLSVWTPDVFERRDFDLDDPGAIRFSYDLVRMRGALAECSQGSVRLSGFNERLTQHWMVVIPRQGSATVEVLVDQQTVMLIFDTVLHFFDLGTGAALGNADLSGTPRLLSRLETPGLLPLAWTGSELVQLTDLVPNSQIQRVVNLLLLLLRS